MKTRFATSFYKGRTKYYSTLTSLNGATLHTTNSDVSLKVAQGIRSVVTHAVYTDCSRFKKFIPDAECLVSPIVEYSVKELEVEEFVSECKCQIIIPHCLHKQEQLPSIRVRYGDLGKRDPFQLITSALGHSQNDPYYEVDEKSIRIFTNNFSTFICTSCDKVCDASIVSFMFGSLKSFPEDDESLVKVKTFLCSSLYNLHIFTQVLHMLCKL